MERRATVLSREHRNPLSRLDTKYLGTINGHRGPLVRRLESYGELLCLVVGSFQEASKDVHGLLEWFADAKLQALGLARGREGSEYERSLIIMHLRRELSLAAAKAQSACPLGRLAQMGEGQRLAAKRRAWTKREEERRQEAAKAHWLANVGGKGILSSPREFIIS